MVEAGVGVYSSSDRSSLEDLAAPCRAQRDCGQRKEHLPREG
jgi:hypothetical protein